MNKRERVLRTLELREPDRVPITEFGIEVPLMEAITGKKAPTSTSEQTQVTADRELEKGRIGFKVECYQKLDFDAIVIDLSAPEDWIPRKNPNGTMVDLWGRVLMLDQRSRAWVPYSTVFQAPEDFDRFELPNPHDPGWAFATEYARREAGEEVAVATFIRDPFAHVWEMFTPLNFVRWMYQKPQLIRRAIEEVAKFNIEIIKSVAEAGADFIISGGDYCEEKGPMVPLRFFDEVIFPNLRRQVDAARGRGVKLIKHTDGNVNPILKGLAAIVDGLHSLDPTAGVDIGEVKEHYGDRLILIGNVAVDNLAKNSREEIVEETKGCIRKASPGGGHILSSSNTWASGAKLENCLAMVETGRKYGTYPIRV